MLVGRRVVGEGILVEKEIRLLWWMRNEGCLQEAIIVMVVAALVAWHVEVQRRYLRGGAAGL